MFLAGAVVYSRAKDPYLSSWLLHDFSPFFYSQREEDERARERPTDEIQSYAD